MRRNAFYCTALILLIFLAFPASSFALIRQSDTNRFTIGFMRVFTAPFQMMSETLNGVLSGPPLFGAVNGVLNGTIQAVANVVGGAFDMAAAAAPYAKYAVFFV